MKKILITAMSANGVIGKDGKLPWHLPEDLKFFKETTIGHPVIMGRKTWESLPVTGGLKGRDNIVISSKRMSAHDVFAFRFTSIVKAIDHYENYSSYTKVFFIGGAQIYQEAIDIVDEMYITHIFKSYEGDAYFTEFNIDLFESTSIKKTEDFEIIHYKRK